MYKGTTFTCTANELVPPPFVPGFTDPLPGGFNSQQVCPITNGDQFLERYDLAGYESEKWKYIAILGAFYIGLNIIGAWLSVVINW